jgi:hypothetical protein
MYGKGLYAAGFSNFRDFNTVTILIIPTCAHLQRYWHIDGVDYRVKYLRDQPGVLEQGRAGLPPTDFLCRAAHIDVDDLCTALNAQPGGYRELPGLGAGNLNDTWCRIHIQVEPAL